MNSWPRVTRILADFGFYSAYDKVFIDSKGAMVRGTLVDDACNILAAGNELEAEWLADHPECAGYIAAFRKFMGEHDWRMIDCQQEVVNKTERYIGHYDQYGFLDGHGRPGLLSLKSGSLPPWCGIQEAFYAMGKTIWRRHALQLKPDGRYTLTAFTDPHDYTEATYLVRAWWTKAKYLGRQDDDKRTKKASTA